MNIITIPDRLLFQISGLVKFPLSPEERDLITAMITACKGTHDKPKKLVGISAPQLGVLKRIILVDVAADGKGKTGDLRVMINPEITSRSFVEVDGPEGCGSIPGVAGIVPRSIDITINYYDERGTLATMVMFEGFVARIIQHELDHLDGVLFPDRLKEGTYLHEIRDDEFPQYRKGEWERWKRFVSNGWWPNIRSQAGL